VTQRTPPARSSAGFASWAAAWGLAALLLAVQAGGPGVRDRLAYDRTALLHGELWRALSGHLVHLGWTHALLNAAGVLLCCELAPRVFRLPGFALRLAALCAGVSGLMLWLSPEVSRYVGLSGVLYGLFVTGLAPQVLGSGGAPGAPRAPHPPWPGARRHAALLLALIAGWAAWQWIGGPSPSEEAWIGGRIVAVAHLWGMAAGGVLLAAECCAKCVKRGALNRPGRPRPGR
jgi:rhomboid family GlyGly-CTERM serine protease